MVFYYPERKNYTFFDIYSKFNDNGFLMNNKSDGGVHVNKIYKNENTNYNGTGHTI